MGGRRGVGGGGVVCVTGQLISELVSAGGRGKEGVWNQLFEIALKGSA